MSIESWAQAEEAFDQLLDDDGPVRVASFEFWPSRILKELDPIAYRVCLMDSLDACGIDSDTLTGDLSV